MSAGPPADKMAANMFALLEHTRTGETHWDFLLETGDAETLSTWRLAANPLAGRFPIAADLISDHRRAYLEFEGEIAGNRGVVKRLDRGEAEILIRSATHLRARLTGHYLRGDFEIHSGSPGSFHPVRPNPDSAV